MGHITNIGFAFPVIAGFLGTSCILRLSQSCKQLVAVREHLHTLCRLNEENLKHLLSWRKERPLKRVAELRFQEGVDWDEEFKGEDEVAIIDHLLEALRIKVLPNLRRIGFTRTYMEIYDFGRVLELVPTSLEVLDLPILQRIDVRLVDEMIKLPNLNEVNDGDQADQAFCLVMEASRVSPKFAARMKSLEFLSTRRAPLEYYRETLLKRSWPQLKVATVPHVLSFKTFSVADESLHEESMKVIAEAWALGVFRSLENFSVKCSSPEKSMEASFLAPLIPTWKKIPEALIFNVKALKFNGIINGYHEAIDLFMAWVENPRIFPNLQSLECRNCLIGDMGLSTVCKAFSHGFAPGLTELYLTMDQRTKRRPHTSITVEGVKMLGNVVFDGCLSSLTGLSFAGQELGDDGVKELTDIIRSGGLKDLKRLHLKENGIYDSGLDLLIREIYKGSQGGLPSLQWLNLENNALRGEVPTGTHHNLHMLNASKNDLSPGGLQAILSSFGGGLKELKLGSKYLDEKVIDVLCGFKDSMRHLVELDLSKWETLSLSAAMEIVEAVEHGGWPSLQSLSLVLAPKSIDAATVRWLEERVKAARGIMEYLNIRRAGNHGI